MGAIRYYGRVLRVAFSHSLSMSQNIIFVALVLFGMGAFFAKRYDVTYDLTPWLATIGGWQIAAGVLGSIFLARLLLAPYWLWKEQAASLNAMTEKALQAPNLQSPNILNIGIAGYGQYETMEDLPDGRVRRSVYIVLRNLGQTVIRDVMVYVEKKGRLEFTATDILPLLNEPFTLQAMSSHTIRLAYRDETNDKELLVQKGDLITLGVPSKWGNAPLFGTSSRVKVSAEAKSGEMSSAIVRLAISPLGRLSVDLPED